MNYELPPFARVGDSAELLVRGTEQGHLLVLGEESYGSWPFTIKRRLMSLKVPVKPRFAEARISFPVRAGLPVTDHSPVHQVRYFVQSPGRTQELLVLGPESLAPQPLMLDSRQIQPNQRPSLRAELVGGPMLWPESRVRLRYQIEGTEHHVVRGLRTEWSLPSTAVWFASKRKVGSDYVELPHLEATSGAAVLPVPAVDEDEMLLTSYADQRTARMQPRGEPDPWIPLFLRVVLDVAWAVDREVWLPAYLANPAHSRHRERQSWSAACASSEQRFVDGKGDHSFGEVLATSELNDGAVEFRYRYPPFDAGLQLRARGPQREARAASERLAAQARMAFAGLAEHGELVAADQQAHYRAALGPGADVHTVLAEGLQIGAALDQLRERLAPPVPLRAGLRAGWLRLARLLGGELDEQEITITGSLDGLPATARPQAQGSVDASRALLRIDLPFKIETPEKLERQAPSLHTARLNVGEDVIAVIVDMHMSVAELESRLRELVQAIRQQGGPGPFR
ncbi:MAG: hypothetical protein KJO07_01890 [Deltaproteobacteria bacterium]|nr:hypothetical protein [Deltaproteobacteria bacterium]